MVGSNKVKVVPNCCWMEAKNKLWLKQKVCSQCQIDQIRYKHTSVLFSYQKLFSTLFFRVYVVPKDNLLWHFNYYKQKPVTLLQYAQWTYEISGIFAFKKSEQISNCGILEWTKGLFGYWEILWSDNKGGSGLGGCLPFARG